MNAYHVNFEKMQSIRISTRTRASIVIHIKNQMHRYTIFVIKSVHMQRENMESQCFGFDMIADCLRYVSAI